MKKSSKFLLTALTCATVLSSGMTTSAMVVNNNVRGGGEIGTQHSVSRGLTDSRLGDFSRGYNNSASLRGYNNSSDMGLNNTSRTGAYGYSLNNNLDGRTGVSEMNYRGFTGSRYNNIDRAYIPSVADNYNTPSNLGTAVNTDNNINSMYGTAGNYRTHRGNTARRSADRQDTAGGLRHPSPYYRNGELNNTGENYGYYGGTALRNAPRVSRNIDDMGSRMRTANIDRATRTDRSGRMTEEQAATSRTTRSTAQNHESTIKPAATKAHNATRSATPQTTEKSVTTRDKTTARSTAPKAHANTTRAKTTTTTTRSNTTAQPNQVQATTRSANTHTNQNNNAITHRAQRSSANNNMHNNYSFRNRDNIAGYDSNANHVYRAHRFGDMHRDGLRHDNYRTHGYRTDMRDNHDGHEGNYRAASDGQAHGTAGFRTATPTNRNNTTVRNANDNAKKPKITTRATTATPRVDKTTTRITTARAARYRDTVTESRNATITFVILLVAIAALLALAIYALMRPRHDRVYSDNDSANRRR